MGGDLDFSMALSSGREIADSSFARKAVGELPASRQ
jgi:hypothetical protein